MGAIDDQANGSVHAFKAIGNPVIKVLEEFVPPMAQGLDLHVGEDSDHPAKDDARPQCAHSVNAGQRPVTVSTPHPIHPDESDCRWLCQSRRTPTRCKQRQSPTATLPDSKAQCPTGLSIRGSKTRPG